MAANANSAAPAMSLRAVRADRRGGVYPAVLRDQGEKLGGDEAVSGLYLSIGWNDDHQAYIGVITEGHLRVKGPGPVTVLDVEKADTEAELKAWFERCKVGQPWEPRS